MAEEPLHDEEMTDAVFARAIVVGVMVGLVMMFLVAAGMVLIGGQGLGISAGIAVWVAFVIGPYAGGLTMLSRAESRSHPASIPFPLPSTKKDEQAAA